MKHPIVLWVEALRSGDYNQCRTELRNREGYCCLGVANDVYRETVGEGRWVEDPYHSFDFCIDDVGGAGIGLHLLVANWLGVPDAITYMKMNDSEEKSFEEIADAIEANYPELFTSGIRMATYDGSVTV